MNIEQYKYSLHFKDVGLERKFRDEYDEFLTKVVRSGMTQSIVLNIVGIAIIYFIHPENLKAVGLVLGIPAILIFPFLIYASQKVWYKGYNHVSVALSNLIIGAQLIFLEYLVTGFAYPALIGLIFLAFFGLYLYQIRQISLLVTVLPYLVFYQFYIFFNEEIGTKDQIMMSFWIWAITVFAVFASRLSETEDRRLFIYQQIIKEEQQKSDRLLLNILPEHVAKELKATGKSEPRRFENVTILFTDFKGFTELVASIPAITLVKELNDIFSQFDDIMAEEGVEKIQTIGDAYVAICGILDKDSDHAYKCVRAAKRMLEFLETRNTQNKIQWVMRVGIHSGPIVAGVVGKRKFAYNLFGDTINTASRFETTSEPGKVNISSSTYEEIKDRFSCEYRGKIQAKGKGELDMYFVK